MSPLISEETLRTFFAPFGDIHYVSIYVGYVVWQTLTYTVGQGACWKELWLRPIRQEGRRGKGDRKNARLSHWWESNSFELGDEANVSHFDVRFVAAY